MGISTFAHKTFGSEASEPFTWNQVYRMAWLKKFRDALLDDDGALAKSYGLSIEDIRHSLSDEAILEKIAAHEEVWQSVIACAELGNVGDYSGDKALN